MHDELPVLIVAAVAYIERGRRATKVRSTAVFASRFLTIR